MVARVERVIDPDLLAEFGNQFGFTPAVFLESVWPDGVVNAHAGAGLVNWDGKTWTGLADIATMDVGPEGVGLVPSDATMTVRGAIERVLDYLDPAARNGTVTIWLGAFASPDDATLVGAPGLFFQGYLDGNDADFDPLTGAAALRLAVATGPSARSGATISHSDADQKRRDQTDTGMERLGAAGKWRRTPIQIPQP